MASQSSQNPLILSTSSDSSTLSIANISVAVDSAGRVCLNDLHRAHEQAVGAKVPHKRPYEWLRLKSTSEFVSEVSGRGFPLGGNSSTYEVVKVTIGNDRSTHTHPLIAMEYARWLSPAFAIETSLVYFAYSNGLLVEKNKEIEIVSNKLEQLSLHTYYLPPDKIYNASVIGAMSNISNQKCLRKLLEMGYVTRRDGANGNIWSPTKIGKAYGKRVSNYVLWSKRVHIPIMEKGGYDMSKYREAIKLLDKD